MDKWKRILAMVGVVLLVFMYAMTIITAITATDESHSWFVGSIAMTVFVPAILYAVHLIASVGKQNQENSRMREEMYMRQMREALQKSTQKNAREQAAGKQTQAGAPEAQATGQQAQEPRKMSNVQQTVNAQGQTQWPEI